MLSNRNFLAALGSAAAAVALLVLNKKIATSAQTKQELEAASLASLFDKLGGKPNLKLAVSNFYDKVLKDKRVSHFFKRTDMNLLMNQQQSFLCLLFGGPNRYVGQSMKDAHKNMNITSEQFEVIVNLLIESFEELHVADQLIQEIRQKLDGIKNQIINEIASFCNVIRQTATEFKDSSQLTYPPNLFQQHCALCSFAAKQSIKMCPKQS